MFGNIKCSLFWIYHRELKSDDTNLGWIACMMSLFFTSSLTTHDLLSKEKQCDVCRSTLTVQCKLHELPLNCWCVWTILLMCVEQYDVQTSGYYRYPPISNFESKNNFFLFFSGLKAKIMLFLKNITKWYKALIHQRNNSLISSDN